MIRVFSDILYSTKKLESTVNDFLADLRAKGIKYKLHVTNVTSQTVHSLVIVVEYET